MAVPRMTAAVALCFTVITAVSPALAVRRFHSLPGLSSSSNLVKGRFFDRIIVVPLENTYVADVLANADIRALSQGRCARLYGSFMATTHPSLPNYVTMVAGDYFGIGDDNNHVINSDCATSECDIKNAISIVDRLEDKAVSWGVYVESYPGSIPVSQLAGKDVEAVGCGSSSDTNKATDQCYSSGGCFFGAFSDVDAAPFDNRLYARKHVPFLTFKNFVTNETRCSKVVGSEKFWDAVKSNTLPQYSFYVPDQCHDGHGTHKNCQYSFNGDQTAAVATFVKGFLNNLTSLVGKRTSRTLVVFDYDENDYSSPKNQVFTMAYGCGVVTPAAKLNCKLMGKKYCDATPSMMANLKSSCYDSSGNYGKGTDPLCGPNSGQYTIEQLASPFGIFDGLKMDPTSYTHYSINTLVMANWGLGLMWQGGDGATPLRLRGPVPFQ